MSHVRHTSGVDYPAQQSVLTPTWVLCGLVLPLIVYAVGMVERLVDGAIPFDTVHTYLPLAKQLLKESWSVFSDADSYKVAPGAVVYMALAGAEPGAIKAANMAISLVSLVLAFDAARRIGGKIAAASAAWLYALPHMLTEAGATLLGEAPFVFLVMLWLWSTTVAAQANSTSAVKRRWQHGAVVLAGLALTAATLTRATYMYWLPFATVAFCAAGYFLRDDRRLAATRIAVVHLLATLLVGVYVVKQYETFGEPMVATGSGAALYFGSNPVLSGYEPPYFGLTHDEAIVTHDLGHLSLEGNRRLMAVAKTMLATLPAQVLAELYVQKLGAVLFFSRAHLQRQVLNDRAWRIALVVLAILGVWAGRRQPMVWLIAGAAAYQCAVHVPVLYNPRYSISALDVLLVMLSAQGVAWLWNCPMRRRAIGGASAIIVVGVAAGAYHQRHSQPLLPDLSYFPAKALQVAQPEELSAHGWDGNPFEGVRATDSETPVIEWTTNKLVQEPTAIFHLGMTHLEGRCDNAWLVHTTKDATPRTARIRLEGLRPGQDINWGLAFVMLPATGPSKLTLRFDCAPGTQMHLGGVGIYRASAGEYFRAQALRQ